MTLLKKLIRIVLIAFILIYALLNFDFRLVVAELNVSIVISALICSVTTFCCFVLRLFRLKTYLPTQYAVSSNCLMNSLWLSYGLSNVIPARLSEFIKPVYLKSKAQIPITVSLSILFFERFSDLLALLIFALFCSQSVLFDRVDFTVPVLLCIVAVGMVVILPKYEKSLQKLCDKVIFLPNVTKILIAELSNMAVLGKMFIGFLLAVLIFLISAYGVYLFLLFSTEVSLPFSGCILFLVLTGCSYLVPALPSGFGLYEYAGALVLTHYGFSNEKALVLTLMIHISTIMVPFIASLIVLSTEKIKFKSLMVELKDAFSSNKEHV